MNPPKMPQEAHLGLTLKAMREGVGLTQAEMARRCEVSKSTLSRFESGERVVSPALQARIARVIADRIEEVRDAA